MRRIASRGLFAVLVCTALVGSSLLGLFTGAGSRASAQGPASVLFGAVASGKTPLPSRVRAMIGQVACGSAEVAPTGEGTGFYALVIVSSDTKPGCGVEGAAVRLRLQSGEIDPGFDAAQVLFRPGATTRLDLSTVTPLLTGALVGALPAGPGHAYVRWTGPAGTPVEQALRTLSRDVESVTFWDVQRQESRHFVVGAPAASQSYTMVDTDDVLMVSVR